MDQEGRSNTNLAWPARPGKKFGDGKPTRSVSEREAGHGNERIRFPRLGNSRIDPTKSLPASAEISRCQYPRDRQQRGVLRLLHAEKSGETGNSRWLCFGVLERLA